MHDWLQKVWYGGTPAPWWLRALTPLYGLAVRIRQHCYARGWCRALDVGCPVVVVGNLTVGGTGKTPLVIWLAQALGTFGLRVAVITRGYGRSARARAGAGHYQHDVLRVDSLCTAADVGDEALLIWRRAQVPVYVSRDRVAAGRAAVADGAQLLIADDGLQHLRLARAVEIALIDAARGLGNGALLPAGPLRERATRLETVAAVVLTGEGACQRAGALRMSLAGDVLVPLGGQGPPETLARWRGRRVHAFAGIGNPGRFFATLRAAGLELIEHPLPDHQAISRTQLQPEDGLPVLMTEKDAVKCPRDAAAKVWFLPVDAHFANADVIALLGRILMDARLLDILACPVCKGPLRLVSDAQGKLLVCRADRLGFPLRDGVPNFVVEAARVLEAGDPLLER